MSVIPFKEIILWRSVARKTENSKSSGLSLGVEMQNGKMPESKGMA
jgi:hypothetical protein